MTRSLSMPKRPEFDSLSAGQAAELVEHARALMARARDASCERPLRGKYLGLVCASPDTAEAVLFQRAAAELGANVTVIRIESMESDPAQEMQSTGRVLARLYDALECQGVRPALFERLSRAAGVPVYAGLATPAHPTAALAAKVGGDATPEDKRRFVLQAALLKSLL